MADLQTSNMKFGFLIIFIQNLNGKLKEKGKNMKIWA